MVLRVFRDDNLPGYLELIAQPIFPDESVEWVFPWYRMPLEERRTSALQAHWGWRSTFSPERWQLAFGVYVDDELVGCQDVDAQDFTKRRVVDTGSWLTLAHHGKSQGTRMRQLMLHFAFDHLGAWKTQSSAVTGNEASLGVSLNAGYQLDGHRVEIHGDKALQLQHVAPYLHSPRRRRAGGGAHPASPRDVRSHTRSAPGSPRLSLAAVSDPAHHR